MKMNIPFRRNLLIACLFNSTIIINILKEQDSPIFNRGKLYESEKRILLNGVYHEVYEIFSFIITISFCMDHYFVEICINYFASELLQLMV